MGDLGEIVEGIQSAGSAKQAFSRFDGAVQRYGYNNACFTLLTDHPSIGQEALHGWTTSYPEDWFKHYHEKEYGSHDPICWYALRQRTPFFWDDAVNVWNRIRNFDPKFILQSNRMMREAEEVGIADGFAVGFTNSFGEVGGIAISRAQPENVNNINCLSDLYLISSVFYEKYMSFFVQAEVPRFTKREKDVLAWSAEGKTDWEIAQILSVSTHTVRFHWNNVFKKLKTNNKLHATMTAVRRNVISPGSIGAPRKGR